MKFDVVLKGDGTSALNSHTMARGRPELQRPGLQAVEGGTVRPHHATACGQRAGTGRAWPRVAWHRPALRRAGGEVPAPRERGRAEPACCGARLAPGSTEGLGCLCGQPGAGREHGSNVGALG